MFRIRLVLAALAAGAAWGQAPAYSAGNIVNSSDYSPGPFAPNSVVSIFGTNLSWTTRALMSGDIVSNTLPTALASVAVYVDNWPAPLLYVSPAQINFIVPGIETSGSITVRVVREGISGPAVTVTLADAAPALFNLGTGYTIATHADGSLMTAGSPAHAGDTIVVYATGLGLSQPNPGSGVIPQTEALIAAAASLVVYLDGAPLDWFRIKYAGVTPFSVGLYQINIELPPAVGTDPEIQIAVGTGRSMTGLQIYVD